MNFREHTELIKQLVAIENSKDPNWRWYAPIINKGNVKIRWGYLDYLEEKQNKFIITSDGDGWISARYPGGELIDVYCTRKNPRPTVGCEITEEAGIEAAIHEIAYVAHHRY